MNVYDEAHNLEKAIKESEEYKQYAEMKSKIAENESLKNMLGDFQKKQMAVQAKQMMGEDVNEEMMKSVQGLYGIIMKDPLAAEYLQKEMRFSMMMQDVYKILGEFTGMSDK